MSARNMVRSLRDSGSLSAPPPAAPWQSTVVFFATALAFGAVLYLGVMFGVPALIHAIEKKPPPISYAKPDTTTQAAAIRSDAKPYGRSDELACLRFGAKAEQRAKQAAQQAALANPITLGIGSGRLASLSATLICDAQTRPMRLCDPLERQKFVRRSMIYFDEVATIAAIMGTAVNSSTFSLVSGGQAPDGALVVKGIAGLAMREVMDLHQKVATTYRDLAARGLIAESDYASGFLPAPDAVKVMFADLGPVEDVCSQI